MKLLKALLITALVLGLTGFAAFREPRIKVVTETVEVPKQQKPLKELIQTIPPKYGISPLVMAAIVERESGGQVDAVRFEPSQMARAAKITKNPEKQRAYASSHGLAQVMGWWAPEFNLRWFDLYEPETNIEVASAILKKCADKQKAKSKVERLRGSLKCFNGGDVYADAVMKRIGERLIEEAL